MEGEEKKPAYTKMGGTKHFAEGKRTLKGQKHHRGNTTTEPKRAGRSSFRKNRADEFDVGSGLQRREETGVLTLRGGGTGTPMPLGQPDVSVDAG